jgi:hypothetical protein
MKMKRQSKTVNERLTLEKPPKTKVEKAEEARQGLKEE